MRKYTKKIIKQMWNFSTLGKHVRLKHYNPWVWRSLVNKHKIKFNEIQNHY